MGRYLQILLDTTATVGFVPSKDVVFVSRDNKLQNDTK